MRNINSKTYIENAKEIHIHKKAHPLPSNIPLAKGFIGREEELNSLREAKRKGKTSFVLHGLGGVGKTELALYFISEIKHEFQSHIRVDMRGLDEEALSTKDAMLEIIRVFEPNIPTDLSEENIKSSYVQFLTQHKTIIFLDNVRDREQVEILNSPLAFFVVTSRNTFNLTGSFSKEIEQMSAKDARALLYSVADEVRFEEKADALAYLAGYLPMALLPLASILAEDITINADELLKKYENRQERLRLADPNRKNLSVEASFDLSYELLSDELKAFWCKLAIFPADFDLDAMQAILGVEDGKKIRSELVKKHLLIFEIESKRTRLHDLARDYTSEKLIDYEVLLGEGVHAFYYGRLLTSLRDVTIENLSKFDIEKVNIKKGFSWIKTNVARNNQIAFSCFSYTVLPINIILLRLHTSEIIEWMTTGLVASYKHKDKRTETHHLNNLGNAYYNLGETQKAIEYHEKALAISKEISDKEPEATALGNLANSYVRLGNARKAIEYYKKNLTVLKELGSRKHESIQLCNLGSAYWTLGEFQEAIKYFEESLAISREILDRQGEGSALGNLGNVYEALGNRRKAIKYFEDALLIAKELGDRKGEEIRLGCLGVSHKNLGNYQEATKYYEKALVIAKEVGNQEGQANHLGNLGNVQEILGETSKAIEYFEQSTKIARKIDYPRCEAKNLMNLGSIYCSLNNLEKSIEYYENGMSLAKRIGDRQTVGASFVNLGIVYGRLNNIPKAIECFEQALSISKEIGDKQAEGSSLCNLGKVHKFLGNRREAKILTQNALVIFEAIESPKAEIARQQLAELENQSF